MTYFLRGFPRVIMTRSNMRILNIRVRFMSLRFAINFFIYERTTCARCCCGSHIQVIQYNRHIGPIPLRSAHKVLWEWGVAGCVACQHQTLCTTMGGRSSHLQQSTATPWPACADKLTHYLSIFRIQGWRLCFNQIQFHTRQGQVEMWHQLEPGKRPQQNLINVSKVLV